MPKDSLQIYVVSCAPRSYWVELQEIVSGDSGLTLKQISSKRELRREAGATDDTPREPAIVLLDFSLPDVSVSEIREVFGADVETLAFVPEVFVTKAVAALDEGLDDYVLYERPQRLRIALRNARQRIDAERRADSALDRVKSAEDQHKFLIENILDIITVTDINATILYESASLERVLGYNPEELIGKNAFAYIHPLDIPKTMPVFMLAVATPGVPHSTRFRFKHKNGTWRMLEAVGKTLREPEQGIRLIVTTRDITDRERAEAALGQSELRFRSVIENLSEGITITTRQGELTYVNRRMTELTGFEPNDLLGKKLFPLIIPPEFWSERDSWIQSKSSKKPQKMETEILRKDGSRIWVEIRTAPFRDGDQNLGTISAFVDISERHVFQQQLEVEREEAIRAKNHAEEMSRLKSNFLANMSHEVRTPLTAILGFANVLEEQLDDEELKTYTSLITNAGSRLLETMNSLLDLSRIESGRVELNVAPTVLAPEVTRTLEMFRPIAESKLLSLESDISNDAITALVDPHYFSECLRHVISNAVKFTESGSVRVSLSHDGDHAIVTVVDTGIGISADFLPHICEAFRQESDGFDRRFEGTGLGLTLTDYFLREMGGGMEVASVAGTGSTFTMRFPLPPAVVMQSPRWYSRLRRAS